MSKISIIGASGMVGTAISYALVARNIPRELVLMDINEEKAKANAEDLSHSAAFINTMDIYSGKAEDTRDSDLIIISAGAPQGANITRLTPLKKNVGIFKSLIPDLAKNSPDAIFLIVTNPVDILTDLTIKLSGFPEERVIGSGTLLDTSRLLYFLGKKIGVAPKNINAYVLGEHGDSGFVPWSLVNISGMSLDDYLKKAKRDFTEKDREEIEDRIKKVAFEIVALKGGTDQAIGLVCCEIADTILNDRRKILPISSKHENLYGYEDICISIPTVLGRKGVIRQINPNLTEGEVEEFKKSLKVIDDNSKVMEEELCRLGR